MFISNSSFDLSQTLNSFSLGGVKYPPKINIIGVVTKELHLLEVEGVKLSVFSQIWSQ
jgi:hypothetical protein